MLRLQDRDPALGGSIHVSHILSGRCVAKIERATDMEAGLQACAPGLLCVMLRGQRERLPSWRPSAHGADPKRACAQDVTSIFFNEERGELYVGNKYGVLYVYSQ